MALCFSVPDVDTAECPMTQTDITRGCAVRGNGNRLWRLACDHSFRPGPARNRRRREDREIGVAVLESIEVDLAVPYGRKLAAQKTWRGTMLGRRSVGVHNADSRAWLE